MQDKQCQHGQMNLVESVGSDQRDELTKGDRGIAPLSFGTQPARFLRVFRGEQRRNWHDGDFLHEGDYRVNSESLACRHANAHPSSLRPGSAYASPPGRPPGPQASFHSHRLVLPTSRGHPHATTHIGTYEKMELGLSKYGMGVWMRFPASIGIVLVNT